MQDDRGFLGTLASRPERVAEELAIEALPGVDQARRWVRDFRRDNPEADRDDVARGAVHRHLLEAAAETGGTGRPGSGDALQFLLTIARIQASLVLHVAAVYATPITDAGRLAGELRWLAGQHDGPESTALATDVVPDPVGEGTLALAHELAAVAGVAVVQIRDTSAIAVPIGSPVAGRAVRLVARRVIDWHQSIAAWSPGATRSGLGSGLRRLIGAADAPRRRVEDLLSEDGVNTVYMVVTDPGHPLRRAEAA